MTRKLFTISILTLLAMPLVAYGSKIVGIHFPAVAVVVPISLLVWALS